MAFAVNEFASSFVKPARPSQYEMYVLSPAALRQQVGDQPKMQFRIDTAELPGRSMLTYDHKYYGPLTRVPYGALFTDMGISVLVSEDQSEIDYFLTWQDIISGNHRTSNVVGKENFDMEYFDNFKSTAVIFAYDSQRNVKRQVELIDCYPILVNPVPLNWGSEEVMKLQVTMHFRYFKDFYPNSENLAAN